MSNTLNLGTDGQWATKDGSLLAYNNESGNYKPLPFDFTRASSATVVNKAGLIETVQSGIPRIDFLGNTNGALLLEPQRTNLFQYSEPTTNEGAASNITYESFNWAIGFENCVKFGDNSVVRYRYGATVPASTEVTLSFFIIMDDLSEPVASLLNSSGDFSIVMSGSVSGTLNTNVSMGDNIWKVSQTTTSGVSSLGNNGIIKYTTQSNKGFRVVGFQAESSASYPTSYIPTQGSTVTRVAETCSGAGNDQVFNSTEGVLEVNISALFNDLTRRAIVISDGTTTNRVFFRYNSVSQQIQFFVIVGGNAVYAYTETLTDQTDYAVFKLKWSASDFGLKIDGVEVDAQASGVSFSANTLTTMNFYENVGVYNFYGNIKYIKVYSGIGNY